jgi:hypothetical protein
MQVVAKAISFWLLSITLMVSLKIVLPILDILIWLFDFLRIEELGLL